MKKELKLPSVSWFHLANFMKSYEDAKFYESDLTRVNLMDSFKFLKEKKNANHEMSQPENYLRFKHVKLIFLIMKHKPELMVDTLCYDYTRVLPSALMRAGIQAMIEFMPKMLDGDKYTTLCDVLGFDHELHVIHEVRPK